MIFNFFESPGRTDIPTRHQRLRLRLRWRRVGKSVCK